MQFRHIHIRNFMWCIPPWLGADRMAMARALDDSLSTVLPKTYDINSRFGFNIGVLVKDGVITSWPHDGAIDNHSMETGMLIFRGHCPINDSYILRFTMNFILKEAPPLYMDGDHTVYAHSASSLDVPLTYIGLTKRPWYVRFVEHIDAMRRGSPYLFHHALQIHQQQTWHTTLLDQGFDYDQAMVYEEARIANLSLYPKGLNMIPGGYAGLRYLHRLGVTARNAEERDAATEQLASQDSLAGRPNPLCAARWASDQDYVNRVICGRAGRLTVEQVRIIRLHSNFGRTPSEIAASLGSSKIGQIARAWSGNTYARVR